MQIWKPEPTESQLLDWWLPLIRAGRRVLVADVPWLIHLDEWELWGRVIRRRLPDVWVYRHHVSGGDLLLDHTGQAYRFIPNRTGNLGRFKEIPIRIAIWRSGLPEAADGARGVLRAVR